MSSHKKKKKKKKKGSISYVDVELNIMPFIDVFSLLVVFLLMSAVFLSIGILEVQIPFLSNNQTLKDPNSERTMTVKVDMERDKIDVITAWTRPPINEETKSFKVNTAGFKALHKYLVEVRLKNPQTDKVEFFTEDDVIYNDMTKALDSIKLRLPGDPVFPSTSKNETTAAEEQVFLFPKIVMASVIL